jgi:tryptophan halogenase
MPQQPIRKVVIVGGGTAGWMAAAALANDHQGALDITLVESTAIGTVGVGEATVPGIRDFYRDLGLDEPALMRATNATVKLGIQFRGWDVEDGSFFHPFGLYGQPARGVGFHHYWLRARAGGDAAPLSDYSLATQLALAGKATRPHPRPESALSVFDWALHFDAALFAGHLRDYALAKGVTRLDRKVVDVALRPADGFIEAIVLEDGGRVAGDLFIDCSGFRGLLIEQALRTGYQDWTHWLPCDRAVAMPCERAAPLTPYTRASADAAGWRWRIPLQHRVGNGYVYSSAHLSDDAAIERLTSTLEGKILAEPNLLRFVTGRRNKAWNKNCVALGLASGFLEPLESTSISLIQTGLEKLRNLFPHHGFDPANIAEYNRSTALEFERLRDFLILHYQASRREDSDFWRDRRQTPPPESLAHKLAVFRAGGHFVRYEWETFQDPSWLSIYAGMGLLPATWSPIADGLEAGELARHLAEMKQAIAQAVAASPSHAEFLSRYGAANV